MRTIISLCYLIALQKQRNFYLVWLRLAQLCFVRAPVLKDPSSFDLLNNPQNTRPAIHIAGTSGKGSVAYTIEALLRAAGKTTGLTVSPHVADIRERMQINGQFISEAEFVELAQKVALAAEQMRMTSHGSPTYFEAVTAMAFLAFEKNQVDYAIVETGLGGTYDTTNLIQRDDKLAIITQIGLDHTAILGETIEAIADQKAGIIQPGTKALALSQESGVRSQFVKRAKEVKADLELFVPGKHVQHTHLSKDGTTFNLKLKPWIWRELKVGLIGKHQSINAGLAIRAVQILAERDGFDLGETEARSALSNLRIPARFEIRRLRKVEPSNSTSRSSDATYEGSTLVIIDGAHNPQKMQPIAQIIKEILPGKDVTVLIAMKEDKDYGATLEILKPIASRFVTTSFFSTSSDLAGLAEDPEKLAGAIIDMGKEVTIISDPHKALKKALSETKDVLLVTGSFYFIGEIYADLV